MKPKKGHAAPIILLALTEMAAAQCGTTLEATTEIILALTTIGFPIGLFMMIYMGIKWIMAEGAEDRENARRGIIYVVSGLILLRAAAPTITYLVC